MSGYKLVANEAPGSEPHIEVDEQGTTSWRDCKKALRQWYLDRASSLRSVSEKDYFPNQ